MTNSNELLHSLNLINNEEINTNQNLPMNNLINNSFERFQSTSESGIICSECTTPNSLIEQELILSNDMIIPSILYQKFVQQSDKLMKIRGSSHLTDEIKELFLSNEEINQQWLKTIDYYRIIRKCLDNQRIENELYQCFDALINDEKEIMIGLDSIYSLKDLLMTSMRISSEPNFKLEIRIGLGGTHQSLTLRTPSYSIAGILLLERLIKLRKQFSLTESHSENIPTEILVTPPVLTIFSAWTSAVKVNNIDEKLGQKNACNMLSYIRMYIDHYHTDISNYVHYEIDHSNTYEENLLNRIMNHFINDYHDEQIKEALASQAISRGSDPNGSIQYASMHLIIFKDIIEKTNENSLFYLLDENNNQINQPGCLYDCIITIGGSVEIRFNKVRYLIQQFLINHAKINNENNFHFPLSIRMLSKCGQTPVYYHYTNEITVDQILSGHFNDLDLKNQIYKGIKQDLSILIEDTGISVLEPIWKHISNFNSLNISSWKNIVLTLIELCLELWRVHAKDLQNRKCQCLVENQTGIEQICEHYQLLNDLNDDGRLIIQSIIEELEKKIQVPFAQINTQRRHSSICVNKDTTNRITEELDHVLSQILINFIHKKFH